MGVIPVVNENDSVSYTEIKSTDCLFGDNVMLSVVLKTISWFWWTVYQQNQGYYGVITCIQAFKRYHLDMPEHFCGFLLTKYLFPPAHPLQSLLPLLTLQAYLAHSWFLFLVLEELRWCPPSGFFLSDRYRLVVSSFFGVGFQSVLVLIWLSLLSFIPIDVRQ